MWLSGQALPVAFVTFLVGTHFYTAVPVLAGYSGLMVPETGVDWKTYFVLYRMSYFTSVPSVFLMYFGPGERLAFGEAEGGIEDISLTELTQASYKYFRAFDGFVALNLTKGITETLDKTVHNRNVPRRSRYRDAEIVNNREPFSNEEEPTVPPGFMETYRIAPVFLEWAPCTTRYRISAGCLNQNQVVGWAIAQSRALCTNLRMVSCREQNPLLDPVYRCAKNRTRGADYLGGGLSKLWSLFGPNTGPNLGDPKRDHNFDNYPGPIQGLCGRSIPAPNTQVGCSQIWFSKGLKISYV